MPVEDFFTLPITIKIVIIAKNCSQYYMSLKKLKVNLKSIFTPIYFLLSHKNNAHITKLIITEGKCLTITGI